MVHKIKLRQLGEISAILKLAIHTSQDENKIVKNQEQLDSNKMTEVKIKKYVDTRPPEQKVFYDQDLLELIFSHIPIGK